MANVLIDDLSLLPSAENDVVFLVDNGILTHKSNFSQLREFLGVPIGAIFMWPAAVPSTNFLICDGSAISRTTYAALFAIIGTTYGVGNGSTTFNLPNFQGLVPRGTGSQAISGRTKTGPALGSTQEDQMQKITGTFVARRSNANNFTPTDTGGAFTRSAATNTDYGGSSSAAHTLYSMDSANSPNARASSTTDGETRASSLGVNFVIKFR